MLRSRYPRTISASLVVAAAACLFGLPRAAAAQVEDVRAIRFPVGGPVHYTDDFGSPRDGHTHQGNDILAAKLQPIYAAVNGHVSWLRLTGAGYPNAGNILVLRDAEGWEYWYIHINNDSPGTDDNANPPEWSVRPGLAIGRPVYEGELVAYVGDSGNAESTSPHLHFEIHRPDGTAVNPYPSLVSAQAAPFDPGLVASSIPFGHLDVVAKHPGGVSVAGWAIDPNTADPISVSIFDNGFYVAGIRADHPRPDVGAAFPAAGPNHGFQAVFPQADGAHAICAYAINDGAGGSTLLGCGLVTIVGSPIGNIDIAERAPAGALIAGWAIDPDTAGPVAIQISVDDGAPTAVQASRPRPDVGAAFPSSGPDHGFETMLALGPGNHKVCVVAQNVGNGIDRALGCPQVFVANAPFGNVDIVLPGAGGVAVGGWAIDPDTSAPIGIQIVLDGSPIWTGTAGGPRPDVGAVFHAYGGAHGFDLTVPAGPGHTVCVLGLNTGPGVSSTLGCRAVTLSGRPFGNLDSAGRSGSAITLAGWVIDPDTTLPVDVHIYVDGAWGTATVADRTRTDVGVAFPAYGSAHGYDLTIAAAPGPHQVCIYGINAGPADANPLLACRMV